MVYFAVVHVWYKVVYIVGPMPNILFNQVPTLLLSLDSRVSPISIGFVSDHSQFVISYRDFWLVWGSSIFFWPFQLMGMAHSPSALLSPEMELDSRSIIPLRVLR